MQGAASRFLCGRWRAKAAGSGGLGAASEKMSRPMAGRSDVPGGGRAWAVLHWLEQAGKCCGLWVLCKEVTRHTSRIHGWLWEQGLSFVESVRWTRRTVPGAAELEYLFNKWMELAVVKTANVYPTVSRTRSVLSSLGKLFHFIA